MPLYSPEALVERDWREGSDVTVPVPKELHPDSKRLVKHVAEMMATKLRAAEKKYGYQNNWATEDWEHVCQSELRKHLEKGDPLDVLIYAAFMIYRGWPIRPEPRMDVRLSEENDALIEENKIVHSALNEVITNGEWRDGDWVISEPVYRMAQDARDALWQELLVQKQETGQKS